MLKMLYWLLRIRIEETGREAQWARSAGGRKRLPWSLRKRLWAAVWLFLFWLAGAAAVGGVVSALEARGASTDTCNKIALSAIVAVVVAALIATVALADAGRLPGTRDWWQRRGWKPGEEPVEARPVRGPEPEDRPEEPEPPAPAGECPVCGYEFTGSEERSGDLFTCPGCRAGVRPVRRR